MCAIWPEKTERMAVIDQNAPAHLTLPAMGEVVRSVVFSWVVLGFGSASTLKQERVSIQLATNNNVLQLNGNLNLSLKHFRREMGNQHDCGSYLIRTAFFYSLICFFILSQCKNNITATPGSGLFSIAAKPHTKYIPDKCKAFDLNFVSWLSLNPSVRDRAVYLISCPRMWANINT